jgi:uncharacterized protein YjbJ (UPF0337 family)
VHFVDFENGQELVLPELEKRVPFAAAHLLQIEDVLVEFYRLFDVIDFDGDVIAAVNLYFHGLNYAPSASQKRNPFDMKSSTKDRAKGRAKEIAGKVQEKAGRATGNPRTEDRGSAKKIGGKVQRKVGEVKKVFGG